MLNDDAIDMPHSTFGIWHWSCVVIAAGYADVVLARFAWMKAAMESTDRNTCMPVS